VEADNEIRAIKRLCVTRHPNIVQVVGYGELKRDSMFCFIDMELCDVSLDSYLRGDLEIEGISWKTAWEDEDQMLSITYKIL
jgi:hypothetical protein